MSDNAMSVIDASNYAPNIGKIVIYLGRCHEPGDFRDCSINDPIVNIIDTGGSAADFVRAIATFSAEKAAGIVRQLGYGGDTEWANLPSDREDEERP